MFSEIWFQQSKTKRRVRLLRSREVPLANLGPDARNPDWHGAHQSRHANIKENISLMACDVIYNSSKLRTFGRNLQPSLRPLRWKQPSSPKCWKRPARLHGHIPENMLHIYHPKTVRAHTETVLLDVTGDFFHVLSNSMFTNHTTTRSHT